MPGRPSRPALSCAALAAAALLIGATAAAAASPGARSAHDSFFPSLGNGGYDAGHYDVRLAYSPRGGRLKGRVAVDAVATQDLSSFSLDLRPRLRVLAVSVNGVRARARRPKAKLIITPAAPLADGTPFTATVRYRGRPQPAIDPDKALDGWIPTRDGAFVANEPQGVPTWMPSNASLTDKASYDFRITVPRPLKAIANGRLRGVRRRGDRTTWSWSESQPMAAYLATATIGRFRLFRSRIAGLPSWVAVDPRTGSQPPKAVRRTAGIIAFFARRYGPYPFDSLGAIVDRADVGYALETQTRPIYEAPPNASVHAHELAHQWFGDSVGFARWRDIWLAEGFAQWSMWLWRDHVGVQTIGSSFRHAHRVPASNHGYWNPPPGRPGAPKRLFDLAIYARGAMAVEAFRRKVGNADFYATLRAWLAQRRYGTGTVGAFTKLAERTSGRPLNRFFGEWLYKGGKPGTGGVRVRPDARASTSPGSRTGSSAARACGPPCERHR